MTQHVLAIGGYTDRDDLPADAPRGLALHDFDADVPRLVLTLPVTNATWLEWDEFRRVLYISQSSTTSLTAVSIPGGSETAHILDEIDIGALNPAHFTIAPTGDAVVAACFTAGEVVTVSLLDDGRFDGVRARTSLSEGGTAEPHQVSFGAEGFAVPDRARDEIHRFSWRTGEAPVLLGSDALPAGRGPRHLARHPRHPDVAYLAGEFDSTLTVMEVRSGAFVPLSAHTTLPAGAAAENSVAAVFISTDARHLFVSNRGHDSLAVFDISDPYAPRSTGWIPAGGRTPRFAGELAPGRLAIAALDSHTVGFVPEVGSPGETSIPRVHVRHGAPACVRLFDLPPAD